MNPSDDATARRDSAAGGPSIILFDATCDLCNAMVRFLGDRDRDGRFRFVPNDCEEGRKWLDRSGLGSRAMKTVILIERGRAFTRSDAALRILRRLKWPWPLLFGLVIVPRFLRDAVYSWVSRNRHKWSCQSGSCRLDRNDREKRSAEEEKS